MLQFPPRRILAGTDLSPNSLDAWRQAADWGKRFGAQAKAVHARGPEPIEIPGALRVPNGAGDLERSLREEFRKAGGASELEIVEGEPVVSLVRVAKTWEADLIVVGTHGRSGVSLLLLGSVAEALLRESPVPVLVVREAPRPVRSVLAPMNFTSYSGQAFLYAAAVAANLKARLTVHHGAGAGETFAETRARLDEELMRLPKDIREACSPHAVVSRGDEPDAIARVCGGYDLVVLSGHRKGFLRDLMAGTTAQQIVRGVKTPLLAVPAEVERGRLELNRWASAER